MGELGVGIVREERLILDFDYAKVRKAMVLRKFLFKKLGFLYVTTVPFGSLYRS